TDPAIVAQQEARFRQMKSICDAAGARLEVVVFPFFGAWGQDYRFDACHDVVAAGWRKVGVEVIDLRGAYRGISGADLAVSRLDSHPNERAHAIAAQVILDRVFSRR
ncbi:MAG: hypothetical protein K8T90_21355, partial [Planctomycetes bacterium]|nr:hypothetical protein [Planctomycetota bacterium]